MFRVQIFRKFVYHDKTRIFRVWVLYVNTYNNRMGIECLWGEQCNTFTVVFPKFFQLKAHTGPFFSLCNWKPTKFEIKIIRIIYIRILCNRARSANKKNGWFSCFATCVGEFFTVDTRTEEPNESNNNIIH